MRRRRFTATLAYGTQEVILAYSVENVRNHYSRRGVNVRSIVLGDHRSEARRRAVQQNGGGWRIDRAALRDACDLLGLKLPVSIRYNSRVGRTNGNYRFRNGGHDIMLKSYRTAEEANETLWHELTHAVQVERMGGTAQAFSDMLASEKGLYKRAPTEIEARDMARRMCDIPLVVAR